jgi:hypothetical protein
VGRGESAEGRRRPVRWAQQEGLRPPVDWDRQQAAADWDSQLARMQAAAMSRYERVRDEGWGVGGNRK